MSWISNLGNIAQQVQNQVQAFADTALDDDQNNQPVEKAIRNGTDNLEVLILENESLKLNVQTANSINQEFIQKETEWLQKEQELNQLINKVKTMAADKIKRLLTSNDELIKKNELLSEQINQLHNPESTDDLQSRFFDLQTEYTELQLVVDSLSKENVELKETVTSVTNQANEMRNVQTDFEAHIQQINDLELQNNQLKEIVENVGNENRSLNEKLETFNDEINTLQETLTPLKLENDQLKVKLESFESDFSNIQNTLESLQFDNDQLKDQLQAKENNTHDDIEIELRKEIDGHLSNIEGLQLQNTQLSLDIEALKVELNSIKNKSETDESSSDQLKLDNQKLKNTLKQIVMENKQNKATLKSLESENVTLTEQISHLQIQSSNSTEKEADQSAYLEELSIIKEKLQISTENEKSLGLEIENLKQITKDIHSNDELLVSLKETLNEYSQKEIVWKNQVEDLTLRLNEALETKEFFEDKQTSLSKQFQSMQNIQGEQELMISEQDSIIVDLNAQLQQLTTEYAAIENELKELRDFKAKNELNDSKVEERETKIRDLEARLADMDLSNGGDVESEMVEKNQFIDELQLQIKELQNQLDDSDPTEFLLQKDEVIKDLEIKIRDLQEQIKNNLKSHDLSITNLSEQVTTVTFLEHEIETTQSTLESLKKVNVELQKESDQKEKRIIALETMLQQRELEFSDLVNSSEDIEKVNGLVEQHEDTIKTLQIEIQHLKKDLEVEKQNLNSKLETIAEKDHLINQLEIDIDELQLKLSNTMPDSNIQTTVDELNQLLTSKDYEIETLQQKLQDNSNSNEMNGQVDVEQIAMENESFRIEIDRLNMLIQELQSQLSEYQTMLDNQNEVSNQLNIVITEREEYKAQCMELERNCVELQSVMENLSLENQNLDQERNNLIEQMKNIKSAVSVKIQTEMAESERLRNVLLQTTEENEVLRNQIQEFDQQLKHNVQYDNQLDKEKDTHLNHLQTRIEQLTEQNQKSDIELQRLRNYLIEVEDNFTQDSLALQSTIEEYKKQVIEFENERDEWQQLINQDNDQRESEQELILEMKSDLSKQLSIIEGLKTKSQQDQLSIQNLQQVLSQFESSKQMEIEETVLLLQKNINELQQKSNEFENLYNNAMIQLKEYQENLQTNLKTNIEIELKEKNEIIGQLRHDVIQLQSHLSEAMRRMRSTTSEDSVDKALITNLIIGFVTSPHGDRKRFEILGLISTILKLNDLDKAKLGLIRAPNVSISPRSTQLPQNAENFMDMWISFLQNETTERKDIPLPSPTAGTSSPLKANGGVDSVNSVEAEPKPAEKSWFWNS